MNLITMKKKIMKFLETISSKGNKESLIEKCLLALNEDLSNYSLPKNENQEMITDITYLDVIVREYTSFYKLIYYLPQILTFDKIFYKIGKAFCDIKKMFIYVSNILNQPKISKLFPEQLNELVEITKLVLEITKKYKDYYNQFKQDMITYFGEEIKKNNNITIRDLNENFEKYGEYFKDISIKYFEKNPKIFEENFQNVYYKYIEHDDIFKLLSLLMSPSLGNCSGGGNENCCK